mgnify:CR=1 FL=1
MPARGVGVIELRGEPLTPGYITMGGFMPAQDEHGWYDTGDLGYLTENGHIVVCGRVKDVIIMAGRSIYPTDVERAAGSGRGCPAGLRGRAAPGRRALARDPSRSRWSPTPVEDPAEVRRIKHQVAHEVVAEVDMRPRNVVVLGSGHHPEDAVGQAAPRPLGLAGHLVTAATERACTQASPARTLARSRQ